MQYRQLTSGERYTISSLRRQGLTPTEIANEIGRHQARFIASINETHATMSVIAPLKRIHEPVGVAHDHAETVNLRTKITN